MTLTAFYPA